MITTGTSLICAISETLIGQHWHIVCAMDEAMIRRHRLIICAANAALVGRPYRLTSCALDVITRKLTRSDDLQSSQA